MNKLSCLLGLLLISYVPTNACTDPPDQVVVNILIDSINCDAIIEVSNLRIMGGNPNQFCSCGINDQIALLGAIQYVAFVDSTSNTPVLGFDQFALNGLASSAWGQADDAFDWNGFVSEVNDAGLLAGQAIKLWIRLELADEVTFDGITFNPCDDPYILAEDENFFGAIGTGEWNDVESALEMDHMGIAYFLDNPINVQIISSSTMNDYDNIIADFYLSLEEEGQAGFTLFPNPSSDILRILGLNGRPYTYEIYSAQGLLIESSNGAQEFLNISQLEAGFYFLTLESAEGERSLRFVKE